jgi:ketol-acid reductoisomerase
MNTITFTSKRFEVETIELAGRVELFVRGGRHLFAMLPDALEGVDRIGVIGWGSQGPAQAQNLRESLERSRVKVTVGLRPDSPSAADARAVGFDESDGTLGEMFEVIRSSDLVLLLIADAAQAALYPRIFDALRPGATLGLSHGFLLGHMANEGASFPSGINVVGVCPKGMGPSVRRLYEQGREINGAGINSSFAVEQDVDGRATDIALAWAVGLGSPYTFMTTLTSEYRSDIYGERGILLGAVWGIVESLYRRYTSQGMEPEEAFARSCEAITGPIARTISSDGILGVYDRLDEEGRATFARAYEAAYTASEPVLAEIYDDVASGIELASVVMAGQRLVRFPMPPIEGTRMWGVGQDVRATRDRRETPLDAFTAGVFVGVMMAQIDLLVAKDHPWSEIANESVIEAVDSLLPYMHARGVAYMVDNCSTTARLGTRKWAPRFDYALDQIAFTAYDAGDGGAAGGMRFAEFERHPIHDVLKAVGKMRPPVDIAVT